DGANTQRQTPHRGQGHGVHQAPQLAGGVQAIEGAGKAVVVEVLHGHRLVKEQTKVEVFVELPDPVQGLAMTDDVDDESNDTGAGREIPLLLVPIDHAFDIVSNAKVPVDHSN